MDHPSYARNGEGHATRYGYDGLSRLTSIIPPTGNATTITYSHPSSGGGIRFGGILKTAQRGSLTQTTDFDGFGHPLNVRLGDIHHFYYYDALGHRTVVSNPGLTPDNYVTRYDYDSLDRVVRVTHPDGTQRNTSHGAGATTVTDERGNATTYRYRAHGDPGQRFLMEIDAPEPAANVTLARNGVDLVTTVTQDGLTRTYQTVTATFLPLYPLTVTQAGMGAGTVTSNPASIDCGADCDESYPAGGAVTLTATAASGSAFAGWSGACAGIATPCTVAMDAAKTVTATFAPAHTLKVTQTGGGEGTVTSSPAGIDCGATRSALFPAGGRELDLRRLEQGLLGRRRHLHRHHERRQNGGDRQIQPTPIAPARREPR
ncbi:MAG: hypothetical protein RKO66_00620 [Candidatus Contendobacter sp.]|nr:hypothetical protein [Candidatus Contendobacter sp.]MDS4058922.1 hypothetical protein [Candidatus Contendobacter sp.]